MSTSGTIRTGIGGWTFEPWEGTFYPEKLPKKTPAGTRQPAAHGNRGERHLLQQPETGDLCEMGIRSARGLRVFPKGKPLCHQPQGSGRGR